MLLLCHLTEAVVCSSPPVMLFGGEDPLCTVTLDSNPVNTVGFNHNNMQGIHPACALLPGNSPPQSERLFPVECTKAP